MTEQGQTLVEFLVTATLLTVSLTGAGWLLRAQWERGKCAYLVFETTHARLTGRTAPFTRVNVRISDTDLSVTGEARCKDSAETVTLPKLEAARW